jgi:RNA polymerase sigma factor (sigma-70 family)
MGMITLNQRPISSDDTVPPPGAGLPNASDQISDFVSRDYGKVVAAVGVATGDRDAAEDGVQSALLKVVGDGHEPDRLAAWVTVVAINEVRQAHRRRKTEHRVTASETTATTTQGIEDVAATTDLRAAIRDLPERQREIVLMFYYLDTSVADIAEAMGISHGTVKTQLHRARGRLASTLGLTEQGVR